MEEKRVWIFNESMDAIVDGEEEELYTQEQTIKKKDKNRWSLVEMVNFVDETMESFCWLFDLAS
jgi:hypothetical protein